MPVDVLTPLRLREKLLLHQLDRTRTMIREKESAAELTQQQAHLAERLRRAAAALQQQPTVYTPASDTTCSVCLDETTDVTACGHSMHDACMAQWAAHCMEVDRRDVTCPLCRTVLF